MRHFSFLFSFLTFTPKLFSTIQELERAYFEDINANAKLLVMGMDAYSAFLAQQRAAMAAAGTTTTAPPVGSISHAMAVEKYHRMLSELIVRGNYYIITPQLESILSWATVESATKADSDSSWRLLMSMVHDRRKEIEIGPANEFLLDSLCAVEPEYMSWSGWRCLTLYMAVVGNWNLEVKSREGYRAYDFVGDVVLRSESQWGPFRTVLLSTALHAKDPSAIRAANLLSRLVAHDAQTVFTNEQYAQVLETELSTWQNELEAAVKSLCGRLPESGWYDAPPLDTTSSLPLTEARQHEMKQASITAKRALLYLQQLIENGQAKSLPVTFSHSASYRDSTAVIDLQLPGSVQNQAIPKLSISLPKNSYVGVLRSVAAEKVSTAIGRPIAPAYLRLISSGKELAEDGVTMTRTDVKPTVMLAHAPHPNPAWELSTLPQVARDELLASGAAVGLVPPTLASDALVAAAAENPNCNIYSLALTMEQIHLPKECDENGSFGHHLRTAAKGLLNALPTCTQAIEDVQRLLLTLDKDVSRTSLLRIISSPDGTFVPTWSICKAAVMRYLIEALCVLILPANNPLATDDAITEAEERAAALQSRFFASGMIPTLLEVAAVMPAIQAVSAAADYQLHVAMILLAYAVAEDILNRRNFALETNNIAGDGGGGSADADGAIAEDTFAVQCISSYTLSMMHMALSKGEEEHTNTDGSTSIAAIPLDSPSMPPPLASSEIVDVMEHWADDLCYKGLNLLRTCIDAVPPLATLLVSPPSSSAADALDTTATAAEAVEKKGGEQNILADRLSRIILTLLSHPKQGMRVTVTHWIHRFVAASPEARSWTFSNTITPLLLAIDSNEDQTFLITSFLSNLNDEEAVVAEGVLDQLVTRFVDAVESGNIGPVKATAESILILIKRLECHSIAEKSGLVLKLLQCCLFPELDVLASVHPEKGSTVSVEAIFEAHPRALLAAQHGIACRDVCFELLFELMTHNRASWDAAQAVFMRLIDAGASVYPGLFRNVPLPSLRMPNSLCGLINGGATCYMNATFQQLFMQPTVRRLILSAPAVPTEEQDNSVFHQVQTMFAHLAAGVAPFYEPRGFWRAFKDYEGNSVNIREHQDAYEFFTRLQDSVDEHLHSRGHPRAIHAALGGTFAQVITVAGRPELRSQRNEDFYQVSLDVRGKKGLTESLESYVAVEMMNGENQWLCEELGKKVDAEKRTLIGSLPNTLMLHLKRFEWDYETYQRWKVKDRFEFPLELDMKPYTVEGCAAMAAAATKDKDGSATATGTASNSSALHPDAYYKYELRGIVVHSGTAFAGHYYSYIKDRSSSTIGTAQWNHFDDTNVEPWDPATLENDCFGGKFRPEGATQEYDRPNSAYMLIYERIQPVDEEETVKEGVVAKTTAATGTAAENDDDVMMVLQGPGADQGLNLVQQEDVARSNIANIAMVHLFSPELFNFFTGLSRELRAATAGKGVKSRKVARGVGFTSPSSGTALAAALTAAGGSNNNAGGVDTGLARMTSRHRPEEIVDILSTATVLCCNYLYNVLARGPMALINDLSARKGDSFVAHLTSVFRSSKIASSTLLQTTGNAVGVGLQRCGMSLAITCHHNSIREGARMMLGSAVKQVVNGFGPAVGVDLCGPVIACFIAQLTHNKKRLANPMGSHATWDEILAFLDEIFCDYECLIELLLPHMEALLEFGIPLIDGYWSMCDDDKLDFDFGKYYLSLLSIVMCRFDHTYLSAGNGNLDGEDDRGAGSDDEGDEINPHCFAPRDGSPIPPLPKHVWDFFFADETFLRRLMLPGCITNPNSSRLFQWLWYNNYAKHMAISKALLDHLDEDVYHMDDFLAAELPHLADILTMKDILTPARYKEILMGETVLDTVYDVATSSGNTNTQLEQPRGGLIEMTSGKLYLCRSCMLIRLIALMHQANESIFYDVVELDGNDPGRVQEWAKHASERVEAMQYQLKVKSKFGVRWMELANECVDGEGWFQVDDLYEQLLEMAGEYEYDDDEEGNPDNDDVNLPGGTGGGGTIGGGGIGSLFEPYQNQQQYPQPSINMQGGYQGGFGIHGAFGQVGNAAVANNNGSFAFGLIQPSALQQQLFLNQQLGQQQGQNAGQGIIGPALPPSPAVNPTPATTPFASLDLGAPPLHGPPAGSAAAAAAAGAAAGVVRQADISAAGDVHQDDEDDELVAEIQLDGSGEDDDEGDGGEAN